MAYDPKDPFNLKLRDQLNKDRTQNKAPKDSRRDVYLHSAVTIMNTRKQILIAGEQEKEICQLAVEFDYNKIPVPELIARQAFDDMKERAIARMRAYGLVI